MLTPLSLLLVSPGPHRAPTNVVQVPVTVLRESTNTGASRSSLPRAPSADRQSEKLIAEARALASFGSGLNPAEADRLIGGLCDALAAPAPVHIADEAVQKLRGLGLDDTAIRERLTQATTLAAALVSDELVRVIAKIAATAMLTSEELHQFERRGINVKLQRGPGVPEWEYAVQFKEAGGDWTQPTWTNLATAQRLEREHGPASLTTIFVRRRKAGKPELISGLARLRGEGR